MQQQIPDTLRELIDLAAKAMGSQKALALALDEHAHHVSAWKTGRSCTLAVQHQMAEIAGIDADAWVAREVRRQRATREGNEPLGARVKRLLHASALGVLAMLGGFGASDRAHAAAVQASASPTTTINRPSIWRRARAR